MLHGCINKVSRAALRVVEKQFELLRTQSLEDREACSHTLTTTMGVPCCHTLQHKKDDNIPLQLLDFHDHWHLARTVDPMNPELIVQALATNRA